MQEDEHCRELGALEGRGLTTRWLVWIEIQHVIDEMRAKK